MTTTVAPISPHSLMVLGWKVRRKAPPDSLSLLPSTLLLFRGNQVLMGPQGGQAQWGLEGPLDVLDLRVFVGSPDLW